MSKDDWANFLKWISIEALAVEFSEGMDREERAAVTDHMFGVERRIRCLMPTEDKQRAWGWIQ